MAIVEAPDKNAGRAKAAEQGERVTAFHEAEQHCPAEDPHASLAQYLIEARHILCQPLLCGFEPGAVGERAGPDLDGRPRYRPRTERGADRGCGIGICQSKAEPQPTKPILSPPAARCPPARAIASRRKA